MTPRITDTPPVKAFIRIAEKFCRLIEDREEFTEIEILQLSYRILPQLCLCAMNLPDIHLSEHYHIKFATEHWSEIYNSLQQKIKNGKYYHISDPCDPDDTQPITYCIAGDLAEIYENIVPGIKDWPESNAAVRRGIVWEWKFLYGNHWGEHATMGFRAIHFLLFSHLVDSSDDYIGLSKHNNTKMI
jgi:hypothetical protein